MDLLGALEAVFGRTDPSGLRVYSEDLVSDFLPRIVLHALAAAPGTACPPALVALVTAFVEKVGGAADNPAKTASAIEAYYARGTAASRSSRRRRPPSCARTWPAKVQRHSGRPWPWSASASGASLRSAAHRRPRAASPRGPWLGSRCRAWSGGRANQSRTDRVPNLPPFPERTRRQP